MINRFPSPFVLLIVIMAEHRELFTEGDYHEDYSIAPTHRTKF